MIPTTSDNKSDLTTIVHVGHMDTDTHSPKGYLTAILTEINGLYTAGKFPEKHKDAVLKQVLVDAPGSIQDAQIYGEFYDACVEERSRCYQTIGSDRTNRAGAGFTAALGLGTVGLGAYVFDASTPGEYVLRYGGALLGVLFFAALGTASGDDSAEIAAKEKETTSLSNLVDIYSQRLIVVPH